MRLMLKGALERALLDAGPAALSRRRLEGRGLVLAYHNVVPDGEPVGGERSLHLPRRLFARHLEILREEGVRVVPLEELVSTGNGRPRDRSGRRVAITFDDAYRGAVTTGLDELAMRGLPATVFVAPGLLGDRELWWDLLADPHPDGLPPGVRRRALSEARGRNDDVLDWARREGLAPAELPPHARTASESELRAAAGRGVVTLGSHTWSHPDLRRCSVEECRDELARSLEWLGRLDASIPWLAYPYGLRSTQAERTARSVGYRGAFRISGGWLPPDASEADVYGLPRLNVPASLSERGFALRLAGLLCG